MTEHYKTPGVYIAENNAFPVSIVAVPTAVPVFIGYTQTDTLQSAHDAHPVPVKISSLPEFEKYFGAPEAETDIVVSLREYVNDKGKVTGYKGSASFRKLDGTPARRSPHTLPYALQLFFSNGGGACYVVSVGRFGGITEPIVLADLKAGLQVAAKASDATLIVFPEAASLSDADATTLYNAALAQCGDLGDRFVLVDALRLDDPANDAAVVGITAGATRRTDALNDRYLHHGAAYAPNLQTTVEFAVDEAATDVVIVSEASATVKATVRLSALKTADALAYQEAAAAIRNVMCVLPPSAAVAGAYATTDNNYGVWKSPASVALLRVQKPTIEFDMDQVQELATLPSGKSINVIKTFSGRGTLVWGARTLAANSVDWRYVSVRRLITFIETSVRFGMQGYVFEPNNANTWVTLQDSIENFLMNVWKQGGLAGNKPEEAFRVLIGLGKSMTAQDVLDGRFIVSIGVAVLRPAEFISLTISVNMKT